MISAYCCCLIAFRNRYLIQMGVLAVDFRTVFRANFRAVFHHNFRSKKHKLKKLRFARSLYRSNKQFELSAKFAAKFRQNSDQKLKIRYLLR